VITATNQPRRNGGGRDLARNRFVQPRVCDAGARQCSVGTRRSCVPKRGQGRGSSAGGEKVVRHRKEIVRDPDQKQRGNKPMASEAAGQKCLARKSE
jgi:hypothetical protein